ncbi:hypothetical protein AO1008_03264 [Aspergillus oryzae 100-8]|uniref:BHLH domain-containing protein n=1 Tax=Aspergillus oryzae (strain 3.042) TaxID=1160506 RepID=I8AD26_ASPO3|nr:hypothetical protein Ao3042_11232 [Aspergillus oryzae 3.042]KDE77313.1 hypothetical protein AO1008_03264 [Aspergillus oryzae 100-8]|eukprot:EIT83432.1 hypothetical protein Ao3042_11232 [Aspergillus oryzae 3.042]
MSRSRLPPTPAMSGELIVKDQVSVDAVDSFALPPAAMSPAKMESASRRPSKSDQSAYFPASPTSPNLNMGRGANPPRQTGIKRPLEDFDLPPPPTRTRKIIQMKPKTQTQSQAKPAPTTNKPSKESGKSTSNNNNVSPATSKKKQPSATSAAGRKIARKTAHSLIERRRRSKMNEEFATLKDMIPACRGQDMHKLAILQSYPLNKHSYRFLFDPAESSVGSDSPLRQHSTVVPWILGSNVNQPLAGAPTTDSSCVFSRNGP